MAKPPTASKFKTKLLRPSKPGRGKPWSFLILPKKVSETLPRRGRTSVAGKLDGQSFQVTLEPDGQLSHWMKVDEKLRQAAAAEVGDMVTIELAPVETEPEPKIPAELRKALAASAGAKSMWDDTTTIARVDWIHWIVSAKQQKTRDSRVASACDMLASGKRRVCCFDQSGFYSKSLSAPEAAE